MVLLLLALLGALPGVSVAVGLLLPIPAYQMLRAHPGPVFPRAVATRPIAARPLARLIRGVVRSSVCWRRSYIRAGPRPSRPPSAWSARPCYYLEQDGLLLLVGRLTALAVAAGAAILAWETLSATG